MDCGCARKVPWMLLQNSRTCPPHEIRVVVSMALGLLVAEGAQETGPRAQSRWS
jgi:hypothetical protein